MVGRASVKAGALWAIDDFESRQKGEPSMEWRDFVRAYWKFYIPAALSASATIAAIICANRLENRKTAAAVTAFSALQRGFEEYQVKVVEKLGARKEGAVRDEIVQDHVNRNPPGREIIISDETRVLCCDDFTGRYFESNMETLRRAVNDINHQIIRDGFASQTDLFHLIGLSKTGASDGLGWTSDRMLEIRYTTALAEGTRPCMVLDYAVKPIH